MGNLLREQLAQFLVHVLGITEANAAEIATKDRAWATRGLVYALDRLGVTAADDPAAPTVWAIAFESGAVDALRFARAVLSDAACRGRELEALKMIEAGLGHADVLGALRAPQGDQAGTDGTVVAFPSKGSRA